MRQRFELNGSESRVVLNGSTGEYEVHTMLKFGHKNVVLTMDRKSAEAFVMDFYPKFLRMRVDNDSIGA